MSKRQGTRSRPLAKRQKVKDITRDLAAERGSIAAAGLVTAPGLTQQALQLHMKELAYRDELISRSEAKRIAQGLERFDEVIVDFEGVREVGTGFADELFRVWQRDHPNTRLVVANAAAPVQRMIDRVTLSR